MPLDFRGMQTFLLVRRSNERVTHMKMNEQIMLIHPLVWSREDDSDVRMLFVRDLIVPARIGVNHQEQGRTQRVRINLCVYLRPPFNWGDRLDDVLDYDRLRQGVLDLVAQGHINLLETLGERVIQMCFSHHQVHGVHVQIAKLEAHDDCIVGFEAIRRRS
jgi:dihydroneopterin aldolase